MVQKGAKGALQIIWPKVVLRDACEHYNYAIQNTKIHQADFVSVHLVTKNRHCEGVTTTEAISKSAHGDCHSRLRLLRNDKLNSYQISIKMNHAPTFYPYTSKIRAWAFSPAQTRLKLSKIKAPRRAQVS